VGLVAVRRYGGGAAAGETQKQPFQLSFNYSLKVEFQGSRVTSDGGLVLVRELDERLAFGELIARHLADSRGKNAQLPLADLLRRSIYSLLAGYEDLNDAAVVWLKSFLYQAASWTTARRVVAKVEFHRGELFPRVGFIVTNLTGASRAVVRFYNKRGTAEQWIKEGKQAVKMTRLSCHRFRANEVRLWLSLIAYNLGNLWRRLALPVAISNWSLTSLQQRLVKTGGRLVKHARYYWLLLAESHLTRRLFTSMLRKITACRCRRDRCPRRAQQISVTRGGKGIGVRELRGKKANSDVLGSRRR